MGCVLEMRRKPSLLFIFLSVFVDLIGFGIVLPLLPGYAEDNFRPDFSAKGLIIGGIIASFSVAKRKDETRHRWENHALPHLCSVRVSPVAKNYSISIPTGQWSLSITCGRMKARLRRGRSDLEMRK